MIDQTNSFGYWLRRRRRALDLTQEQLARRVGCATETIGKIETDARRPSRQMAERLADCLAIPLDERALFLKAARAELATDRLPLDSEPVASVSAALPSGTVTFLFTDIEGSARLWEAHSQAMAVALARHNVILTEVIAAHAGAVVKTTGDGVLAAFAQAIDALGAARTAQHALQTEDWRAAGLSEEQPLRVRMALHTGVAAAHAGDYVGSPLNRAARLLAATHGGQIVLSRATWELVADQLPTDVELRDLGRHRLKDPSRPEQIFQLIAPDLPATFPALNTLDARRTNLPAQPTPLIGRASELAQVGALLHQPDARLLTLTGPGGIGKTRLGLQVAAELLDDFPDGVYFVDLAPIREPPLVISAIAQTLGIRERDGQPLLTQLKQFLGDKRMLLLLDNFEQVLDAAPLLADLLATASRLKLLTTSRESLHLRGEKEVAVPPLALPDRAQLPPLEELSQYAAVALFRERAFDARADFQLTNANAAVVAEICARLDGLPLAIELAAARSKLFAPEVLLARLSSRLALLTGGAHDLPVRQQTIRNTIAWSYDLLSEAEQTLLRRLGVFVGGCTLEAAEAICADAETEMEDRRSKMERASILAPPSSILDGLAALVDKSLLRQVAGPGGDPRFVMLETIREYAVERLEASGEAERLRQQYARYYLTLGERDSPSHPKSPAQTAHLDRDYDNLWSALSWSQTSAGDPEVALRITDALRALWYHRGIRREAIAALERSLNHPHGVGRTVAHAQARFALGQFLGITGDYAAAWIQYEQALQLAREVGDTWWYAAALLRLGWLAREQGDSATAWARLTESLAISREMDDAVRACDEITFTNLHSIKLA